MAEKGALQVAVTALRGTFPIEGATVTVFQGEYGKGNELARVTTDLSGRTPKIELDAKDKCLSEAQGNLSPFNTYNIYAQAPGYIGQFNMNVPIFSGVTSLQAIDLILLAAEGESTSPRVIDETPDFKL